MTDANEIQQANELTEQMQAMLAEARRYRDEARRFRDESRRALAAARAERAKMLLPELQKGWMRDAIPAFLEPNSAYDAGDGAFVVCHEESTAAEFETYREALYQAGFTEHALFREGALTVLTAYSDRVVVNLSFAESDRILRAVVEPADRTALPPTDAVQDPGAPMVFRQEGDLFEKVDCGMSYIFRLSDGRFFLIDGGWNTPGIAERLVADLYRLSGGEKPEIAAWIFTHAHVDHIGAFCDVAKRFADRVTLDAVIYSFPGESRLVEMGDDFVAPFVRGFEKTVAAFGDVTIYKARTGQRYHFAGLDVEILFTFEDYKMPHPLQNFNDTSLVFRVRTAGQTWMFLGDVAESGAPILAARYGGLLKSDIVQVAHHGYAGGTDELYDLIAAPIVLWPAPLDAPWGPARYSNPEWSPVTRRMVEKYAKTVYVAGEGSTEQELPLG